MNPVHPELVGVKALFTPGLPQLRLLCPCRYPYLTSWPPPRSTPMSTYCENKQNARDAPFNATPLPLLQSPLAATGVPLRPRRQHHYDRRRHPELVHPSVATEDRQISIADEDPNTSAAPTHHRPQPDNHSSRQRYPRDPLEEPGANSAIGRCFNSKRAALRKALGDVCGGKLVKKSKPMI
ncbi:hypothetical protein GUJ93_ZPchr0014g47059 [Zizania palustris]|uniref:Uncharacterized protein n=1 Tax=Zizania palustris TaxID=103762 RepID=A0A8J5TFY6_ZIZPA|nr:hypothetical protein GUJ93_ZPchr0014g47059 [Zizania palustris]